MYWKRATVGSIAALMLTVGCVTSEVSRISDAKYPPRPKGCPVKVFPATTPDYLWEDIASVKARCHYANGRDACVTELRAQACKLGGDTVYGFTDGVAGEYTIVIATVAIKKAGEHAKVGKTPPKPSPASQEGCSPPCSPGYACDGGACIPLCNPPCPDGARCNQQRTCESIPVAAPEPDTDATVQPEAPL